MGRAGSSAAEQAQGQPPLTPQEAQEPRWPFIIVSHGAEMTWPTTPHGSLTKCRNGLALGRGSSLLLRQSLTGAEK